MTTREAPQEACRRCSDCSGCEHHWLDNSECFGPEDPSHVCKHCDAFGDECAACGGEGGEVHGVGLCPDCKGFGVVVVPAPKPRCGCKRMDARDCADFRSGRDMRRMLDAETLEDAMSDEDGGCPCACHGENYAEDDQDYEDGATL